MAMRFNNDDELLVFGDSEEFSNLIRFRLSILGRGGWMYSVKVVVMERVHQWWRLLTFKNATVLVCCLNLIAVVFLLQGFLAASSTRKFSSHQQNSVQLRHIKESEDLRRAMEPLQLIKRVKEIEREAYAEAEEDQQKDTKQSAAVDLVSRLSNFRTSSDASNLKALEEWRKRKIERARQRELGKNGTLSQA